MKRRASLERSILEIQKRNARVEADKAWETSATRRVLIALLTYVVVVSVFLIGDLPRPWLSALIPTLAFVVSTMTLDAWKRRWMSRNR